MTLMTQTEARAKARQLNEQNPSQIHIARAWPLGSWGGQEKGWIVDGPAVKQ